MEKIAKSYHLFLAVSIVRRLAGSRSPLRVSRGIFAWVYTETEEARLACKYSNGKSAMSSPKGSAMTAASAKSPKKTPMTRHVKEKMQNIAVKEFVIASWRPAVAAVAIQVMLTSRVMT